MLIGPQSRVIDSLIGAYHNGITLDNALGTTTIDNTGFFPTWDSFAGNGYPQNIDRWVSNNCISVIIKRADAFDISNSVFYGVNCGVQLTDSSTVTPTNSFGNISNCSFYGVVRAGIEAISTHPTRGGVNVVNCSIFP